MDEKELRRKIREHNEKVDYNNTYLELDCWHLGMSNLLPLLW